ncbi:unnamed protein product [Toxocara canis]|uniref:SLC3A2_N domain-containing protein n=1 Tax=Toxocara canis TaxID=6265 RepID=A0A183U042_TOXCA|nr:unnamed protein product [Toxocara canis]
MAADTPPIGERDVRYRWDAAVWKNLEVLAMAADDTTVPLSENGKATEIVDAGTGLAKYTKEDEAVDVQATGKLIGLTKEQLEKYRNDPFWKPLRLILFVLFWLAWIAMFVGAVLIVVLSPKCAPKKAPEWWRAKVSYQENDWLYAIVNLSG